MKKPKKAVGGKKRKKEPATRGSKKQAEVSNRGPWAPQKEGLKMTTEKIKERKLFEGGITRKAVLESFKKLSPGHMVKNPVMFTVYVGSILTTGLWLQALTGKGESAPGFIFAVSLWLWFTVIFANFAEAMAEGRGKAQADTLRKSRQEVKAKKLAKADKDSKQTEVLSGDLRKDDLVLVEAGDFVPADGEAVVGIA